MANCWSRIPALFAHLLACSVIAFTQAAAPPSSVDTPTVNGLPATVPADAAGLPDPAEYIAKQFGPGYVLAPKLPPLLGDLDGDSQEDVVFIVTGGKPVLSSGAFGFKVIDPYTSYWALGNPSYTTQIPRIEPGTHYNLLIAHSWRGSEPTLKFVVINLPFVKVSLEPSYNKKKKRTVAAISTLEYDGQTGAIIWDGRTGYKFYQLGSVEDQ